MNQKTVLSIIYTIIIFSVIASFSVQANDNSKIRKIVVFHDHILSYPAHSRIVNNSGGTMIKHLPLINGASVVLPIQALRTLGANPGVLRIDDDVIVHTNARKKTPKDPVEEEPPLPQILPWGIDRIDAEVLWGNGYSGAGIKVGIIDTGIDYRHQDLKDNVKGGVNLINSRKDYMDDNGHGTHVAGIIAAANNDTGVVGVAPAASLYGIKSLNRNGSGYLSDIIAGINWAIMNNMDLINMSLGTNSDVLSFEIACEQAASAGIIIVAAAGNDGGAVDYPAAYASAIAVASTDVNDNRPSWSSYGQEVFIAAPGVSVYSTWKGGEYKTASGTSMAAPHVAGVLALYLQAFSIGDYKTVLCESADAAGDSLFVGCGIVDAEEALTASQTGNNLQ